MRNQSTNPWDAGMAWMRVWSECASKMMGTAMPIPSYDASPPDAAREMRSTMLNTWARCWDDMLRSPVFLETMRQTMAGSLQARKQMNDFLGELQHAMQGASREDVDQIMLSLRHLEQRLVDGVERVSDQLDELSSRIEQLEGGEPPGKESNAAERNGHPRETRPRSRVRRRSTRSHPSSEK